MATHAQYSKRKQTEQSGKSNDVYAPESNKIAKQTEIKNVEEWEKQIWFWRSHLDIFIEEYFSTPEKPISFYDFQKVIVRACGNASSVIDIESRSLGKTFKMGWVLSALAVLWPDNRIIIVSKTVRQAMLTVSYIENFAYGNNNLKREIEFPIKMAKDGALVRFKNGSTIEALAMNTDGSNLRGKRAKVIFIDEAAWVKSDVIQSVLLPVLSYKRDIYWKYKDPTVFDDLPSKLFQTSSAYLKSCDLFTRLKLSLKDIKNGNQDKFACAISYLTGIREGIIEQAQIEEQKLIMTSSVFDMEWNAKFIGSADGSYFPYDLTEPCRNLEHVETIQPKGSKSRYILSLDVATSAEKWADNACLCVLKISEKSDGTFVKYLVYIKTFHGFKLEMLAEEVRKACVRFPAIEKIVIDANAIGEGVISLLNMPYVDDENKEHPAFVVDDTEFISGGALPLIRAVKADNKENGRMATATRMYLENKSLHLPVPSNMVRREVEQFNDDNDKEAGKREAAKNEMKRQMLLEEMAIYVETDALQHEMGNIVPKLTASGNVTYDTPNPAHHKDRYSSLAMNLSYVLELEEQNKENYRNTGDECLAVALNW